MSDFAPTVDNPVADKDVVRSFVESSVSVSHSSTKTSGGSVALQTTEGTEDVTRASDDSSVSSSASDQGLTLKANQDLRGFGAQLSANTSGATRALLYDSSGTLLKSKSFTGTAFTLAHPLNSGATYFLTVDDDGGSYTRGYASGSPASVSGTALDIVDGADGATQVDYMSNVRTVSPLLTDSPGTAHVEWTPSGEPPQDTVGWDVAYFTMTADGGSVDIYIEEYQSGAWTEVAGPISRGESIPADPSNDVRFRVELSASSSAGNPSLDSILRRYKL